MLRIFRHTTTYPAYNQTSFNLERQGDVTFHAALHFKYSWGGGGFWLGVRPEVELHRSTDLMIALRKEMRDAQRMCRCTRCGREEWGEPGLSLPPGWDFIHRMDFCDSCIEAHSYRELIEVKEATNPRTPPPAESIAP